MDKAQLRKNRLDLEYHGESQKANAYLILLTTGLLTFIGTFIWLTSSVPFYFGISIALIVSFIGVMLYKSTHDRMETILEEIEKIQ
ncbi:MAG: hypothetical protein V1743_08395 [Nanoarchaeota archaeon]